MLYISVQKQSPNIMWGPCIEFLFNLSESPSDLYICSLGPFQILPLMLLGTIFVMTLPLKWTNILFYFYEP